MKKLKYVSQAKLPVLRQLQASTALLLKFSCVALVASTLAACSSDVSKIAVSGSNCVEGNDPRIQVCNQQLSITQPDGTYGAQLLGLPLSLALLGNITPPTVNGKVLQAADVFVSGTSAYVSYNLAGDTVAGGIDAVSIAVPSLLTLSVSRTFADTKINKLFQTGTHLYAAGSTSNSALGPAVLYDLSLSLLGTTGNNYATATLNSYAGTGVVSDGTNVYTTSGDNGGICVYNASNLAGGQTNGITDARDIKIASNGKVYVVTGQPGSIQEYNAAGTFQRTVASWPNTAMTPQSKSTIVTGATTALASVGEAGVKLVCVANGQTLLSIAAPVVGGVDPSKTVSNAATAGPGVMFVANGEAGVYVYSLTAGSAIAGTSCTNVSATFQGSINFGTAISANNVYYKSGTLVVATGGGFKVVSVTNIPATGTFNDYN